MFSFLLRENGNAPWVADFGTSLTMDFKYIILFIQAVYHCSNFFPKSRTAPLSSLILLLSEADLEDRLY